MNPCPPIERLGALIRGEVGEAEGGAIEFHLERCPSCRIRVHALSDWALLGAFPSSVPMESIGFRSRELLDRLVRHPSGAEVAWPERGELHASAEAPGTGCPPNCRASG